MEGAHWLLLFDTAAIPIRALGDYPLGDASDENTSAEGFAVLAMGMADLCHPVWQLVRVEDLCDRVDGIEEFLDEAVHRTAF